jgi:hypothetical protein
MIEYGGVGDVNDRFYQCTYCAKTFVHLSAQMNHEEDIHGNVRNSMRHIGW